MPRRSEARSIMPMSYLFIIVSIYHLHLTRATVINIPCPSQTCPLQPVLDAINVATVAGTTINLAAGTFTGCVSVSQVVTTGLTIAGASLGRTVIDCQGNGSLLVVPGSSSAALINMDIINGGSNLVTCEPAYFILAQGQFDMNNVTFRNHSFSNCFSVASILILVNAQITNCTFQENKASYGGAITQSGGSLTVTDSRFVHNTAINGPSLGGAIYCEGAGLYLTRTVFDGNLANAVGGALLIKRSFFVFTDCRFVRNTAGGVGGAIATYDGSTNPSTGYLTRVTFHNNTVFTYAGGADASPFFGAGTGAAIANSAAQIFATDCVFTWNTALWSVAGVALSGTYQGSTQWYETHGYYAHNTATYGNGVALSSFPWQGNPYITLSDTTFEYNTILTNTGSGGVVSFSATTALVNNITIRHNSCGSLGALLAYGGSGTVYFSNSTILNNTAANGAGIHSFGSLIMRSCVIKQNSATASGGALFLQYGAITLMDSLFIDNTATDGGGVFAQTASLTLVRMQITHNTAAGRGGGLAVSFVAPTVVVNDTVFTGNLASQGGGIYVEVATSGTFQRLTFISNTAVWGGAFCQSGFSTVTLQSITAQHNVAGYGGAIYVDQGELTLQSAILSQNIASSQGGGVYVLATLTSTNVTITSNTAQYGGGATLATAGEWTTQNTVIQSNTAAIDGGGIFVADFSDACLANSNISDNSAGGNGGGVTLSTSAQLTWSSSTCSQNSATNGGCLHMEGTPQAALANIALTSNAVQANGGAVNIVGGTLDMTLSSLTGHYALSGGAVYAEGSSAVVRVASSTISDNRASVEGGALAINSQASMTLKTSTLSSNTAGTAGGALSLNQNAQAALTGNTLSSNSATDGGGVACANCHVTFSASDHVLSNHANSTGAALYCPDDAPSAPGTVNLPIGATISGNVAGMESAYQAHCSSCGCCDMDLTPMSVPSGSDCVPTAGRSCAFNCAVGYHTTPGQASCVSAASFYVGDYCTPIACAPALDNPLSGSIDKTTAVTGEVVTYSCDGPTYYLAPDISDNPHRGCVGPNWNPWPVYPCVHSPCDPLAFPAHGYYNITPGYMGDTATYHCVPGYAVDPPSATVRTCQFPTWQGFAPTCIPVACPALELPASVSTLAATTTGITGDILTVFCIEGFVSQPAQNLTCVGPNWTGLIPNCTALPCPPIDVPAHASIDQDSTTTLGVTNFHCESGFFSTPYPAPALKCQYAFGSLNWNYVTAPTDPPPASPTCSPLECREVTTGHLRTGCSNDRGNDSTCTIGCQAGYSGSAYAFLCHQPAENAAGLWMVLPARTIADDFASCVICPVGTYSLDLDPECTPCPNGTSAFRGTTSQADCQCNVDFYELHPGAGDCGGCPTGGVCHGNRTRPVADRGYWRAPSGDLIACSPGEACLGADADGNNVCREGHEGYTCATCSAGYYHVNGLCHVCPGGTAVRIVFGVLGGLLVAGIMVRATRPSPKRERTYGFSSLTTALGFVQVVAAFHQLKLPWGNTTQNMFAAASTTNFNIELLSPECVVHFDFYTKTSTLLIIPIILFGVFVMIAAGWLLYHFLRHPTRLREEARSITLIASAGFLYFITQFYLLLGQASLEIFACKENPDGNVVIVSSPADNCYSPEWKSNIALPIFGIVVYIIGVPLLLILLHVKFARGTDSSASPLFHFLVSKFTPQYWFYEVVVMFRKLLLVIFATFLYSQPILQAICCCLVLFISTVGVTFMRPFRWGKHNFLEALTLTGLLGTVFGGVLMSFSNFRAVATADATVIAIVAVVLAGAAVVFVAEIMARCRTQRVARELDFTSHKIHLSDVSVTATATLDGEVVLALDSDGHVYAARWEDKDFSLMLDGKPVADDVRTLIGNGAELVWIYSNAGEINVMSMEGTAISTQLVHKSRSGTDVRIVCAAAEGDRAVFGMDDGSLLVLSSNLATGKRNAATRRSARQSDQSQSQSRAYSKSGKEEASTSEESEQLSSSVASGLNDASGSDDHDYIHVHEGPVVAVALTHYAVYSVGNDGDVKRVRGKGSYVEPVLTIYGTRVTSLAVAHDVVAVGCTDASIRLFREATGVTVTVGGHTDALRSLQFCHGYLFSMADNGVVRMWDMDGVYLQTLASSRHYTSCFAQPEAVMVGSSHGAVTRYAVQHAWDIPDVRYDVLYDYCGRIPCDGNESSFGKRLRDEEYAGLTSTVGSDDAEAGAQSELEDAYTLIRTNVKGAALRQVAASIAALGDRPATQMSTFKSHSQYQKQQP